MLTRYSVSSSSIPAMSHSMWANIGDKLTEGFIFGSDDKEIIIKQLAIGNRLILEEGVRGGGARIGFSARCKRGSDCYFMWLTNDERRRLLARLKY